MLNHGDVTELKVPLGLYPSKDEPVDEVRPLYTAHLNAILTRYHSRSSSSK